MMCVCVGCKEQTVENSNLCSYHLKRQREICLNNPKIKMR